MDPIFLKSEDDLSLTLSEMEYLLSLSHHMAKIKDRNDLLHIINEHMKKLFYFTHCAIQLIASDKKTFSMFLLDPDSRSGRHPAYRQVVENKLPAVDGLIDKALGSDDPMVFDLDSLMQRPAEELPLYVKMHYETGVRETATAPLSNEREKFGLLAFYSDRKNNFTPGVLNIIRGAASLISIAASNIIANEDIRAREQEKEILLTLSYEMAKIRDKNALLTLMNTRLKKLFYFKHSSIIAFSEDRETFSAYLLDPESKARLHHDYGTMTTDHYSVHDEIIRKVVSQDEPVVFDLEEMAVSGKVPSYLRVLCEVGLKEMVVVPLQGDKQLFGLLNFFTDIKGLFDPNCLNIIKSVASQIAIAVSNIAGNEGIRVREQEKETLLSISYEMAKIRDRNELLTLINTKLKNLFYFTHSSISAINEDRETFIVYLTDPESRSRRHPDYHNLVNTPYPIKDGVFETFLQSDEPTVSDVEKIATSGRAPKYSITHYEVGLREAVSIPLHGGKEIWGVLHFYSDRKNTFTPNYLNIIKGVASQVAIAVSNILANEKIARQLQEISLYKQQLEHEKLYLQHEINTAYNYSEIIGSGPAMQKVYRLLSQVSYASSTVLILGETGTGKELIARAIHNSSPYKDKLMIKVNCAALPANLIESELFGHERGSFTGALERRIGKFEMANNSTLFLDEIGEMLPELQVKLLRAIQEKEIERVGGKTPIKVNVRIIAATNRDLQKEVNQGNFRSDLYYRLNVFPIILPPLRDRKEDLPQLVAHFVERLARNAGRKIKGVSNSVMNKMMAYPWPGNVRELEHLIERSVLLAEGSTIKAVHLPDSGLMENEENSMVRIKSIDEVEREHIMNVLKRCNGKIQGIDGAAELLNIPPTTLHSKMKKLGIKKKHTSSG